MHLTHTERAGFWFGFVELPKFKQMLIYLPHLLESFPHLLNIAKACSVENIRTNSLLPACLPPPLFSLSVLDPRWWLTLWSTGKLNPRLTFRAFCRIQRFFMQEDWPLCFCCLKAMDKMECLSASLQTKFSENHVSDFCCCCCLIVL